MLENCTCEGLGVKGPVQTQDAVLCKGVVVRVLVLSPASVKEALPSV